MAYQSQTRKAMRGLLCTALLSVIGVQALGQSPTVAEGGDAVNLTVEQRIELVNSLGVQVTCKNPDAEACINRVARRIDSFFADVPEAFRDDPATLELAAWVIQQDDASDDTRQAARKIVRASRRAAAEPVASADPKPKLTKEERALRRLKRAERQAARAAADGNAQPAEVEKELVTEDTSRSSSEEADGSSNGSNADLLKLLGVAGAALVAGQLLANGDEVVSQDGDRMIVRRDGELLVRKDEGALLRRPGSEIQTETFADGSSRSTVTRENGIRVVTIRDADGNSIRRTRLLTDGREVVLFDDTADDASDALTDADLEAIRAAQRKARAERLNTAAAERDSLRAALRRDARAVNRGFSLRQIRQNVALREMIPPIDLDQINFRTGSAVITAREADALADLGDAIVDLILDNPDEVFLVEGHTDAIGSETSNLALSDRRAESVALALTEYFNVPPESLVVQGYGENYLLVDTQGAARENRRATVRRITPLLRSARAK
ncbi:MAG: OmpA family protein [Pseudomonadota bacterium]